MKLTHEFDDGGRSEAGFRGSTGDCVARAVAIASGRPYREIYDRLAEINGAHRRKGKKRPRSARDGILVGRIGFKRYMVELGFRWVATMHIGSGCRVHLHDDELPDGRLVVHLSRHSTAVIHGVIRDTYDPRREVHYVESGDRPLRDGEWRNINGICGISRRCVYGYWILEDQR